MNWWNKYRKNLFSTMSAALGAFILGTSMGYSADIIPDINTTSGSSGFQLSDIEVSFVVSVYSLGGLLGGLQGGIFLDKKGRKFTLICSTFPCVIGWILVTAAPNVYCLCVGRFLTGFSAGVMDVSAPVYITEISSPSIRGFMGSFHELFLNSGILYTFAFGIFLNWRWLAVACQVIPTLMIVCMLFVPESPRWLIKDGQKEECLKALTWLRSADEDVKSELCELENSVKEMQLSHSEWKEFGDHTVYRPLFIIIGLMLFQQLTGYCVIPMFLVTILQNAGSRWDPYILTAVIGAAGVLSNLVSAVFVDRVGRRVMLLVSATLLVLSLVGLSVYFTLLELYPEMNISENYSTVAFVCILVFNISASLGYGPIPFYLAGELLPLKVRGKAGGVTIAFVWLIVFAISFSFPYITNGVGYYVMFWSMTGFGLLALLFVFIFVPETKGISLEVIEKNSF